MERTPYDARFYRAQVDGSARSARIVVPHLVRLFAPRRVVDVGCGIGTWLAEFRSLGVERILGIDGAHVDRSMLRIPPEAFFAWDLEQSLPRDLGDFDLALSLEVAEHLSPARAAGFVEDLVRLAPVVVFSAAIPGQGGTNHINEMWQSRWVKIFSDHGYVDIDMIRPVIWNCRDVEPWYVQNTLLFVHREHPLASASGRDGHAPGQIGPDVVHPRIFCMALARRAPRAASRDAPADGEPAVREPRRSHRALLVQRLLTIREDALAARLDLALDELRPFTDPRQYARGLDPEEIAVVATLAERLAASDDGSPPGLGEFLAFTAYRPVWEAPGRPELAELPTTHLLRALPLLLRPPEILEREGDASRFARHLEWVLSTVERHLAAIPDAALAAPVLDTCLGHLSCLPVYASDEPLSELYRMRGRLVARRARMLVGDPAASARPRGRPDGRSRIAVIVQCLQPYTETCTTFPCFSALDPDRFVVDLVTLSGDPGSSDIALPRNVGSVHRLPETLSEAVSLIRALDPDVLLFGTNTTAFTTPQTFLGSLRLAPLQLTNFASPVTTGLTCMDLYVSGTLCEDGEESRRHYRERLVRLEGPGFCFDLGLFRERPRQPASREYLRIPPEAPVLVSGANFHKIGQEVRRAWAEILAAVPDAVLVLYPFGPFWQSDYPEALFEEAMRRALAEEGVAPDRLRIVRGLRDREAVLDLLAVADLYLDSFPYSGANANIDPLQLGVPVLTVAGRTLRARQGAAILRDFGLDELVVPDRDAYVREAVALARDGVRRQRLRERILEAWRRRPRCLDPADHARQWQELLSEELARLEHDPARRAFSGSGGATRPEPETVPPVQG